MTQVEPPGGPVPGETDAGQDERKLLSGPRHRGWELLSVLRIGLEFLRGFRALHFAGPCVTVFGSARFTADHPYYRLGRDIGSGLAQAGFTVMTGGGPGLMEAANRGAKESGGQSLGCNIVLPREQHPNPYLDKWVTFDHFYVRKVMLAKYSYAFIALPGGFGTLDELMELLTLVQTGKISGFPVVLMPADFWSPLVEFFRETLLALGTIAQEDLDLLTVMDDPDEVCSFILSSAMNNFGLSYAERPHRRWFLFERD